MISLEKWQLIRERCVGNREPKKRVARETGIAKNTLAKYVNSSGPPQRQGAPTRIPVMTAYEADVDDLLRNEPKITTLRIAHILRDKYPSFAVGERAVRVYIARRRRLIEPKEVFIRQVFMPGDQTQYDFKDIKAHHRGRRDGATHVCSTPKLFDGLVCALLSHRGLTSTLRWSNSYGHRVRRRNARRHFRHASTAVDKVQRGRRRVVNAEFAAFSGSLALQMQFAAPGKGNEKGGVEGVHGYIEDNFFRPLRSAPLLEALNEDLLAFSRADRERRIIVAQMVTAHLEVERASLRPLPAVLPRPCVYEQTRVSKFAEVRCRTNRYSVPSRYVRRTATIELFADQVRIIVDGDLAAQHPRLFERQSAMLDPLHYLAALKHKHRAVERAEVFNNARFPAALRELLQNLVRRVAILPANSSSGSLNSLNIIGSPMLLRPLSALSNLASVTRRRSPCSWSNGNRFRRHLWPPRR